MMLDFQQKRKVRSWMYNRLTIALLFIAFVFIAHSTWVVYMKKVESEEMMSVSLKNVETLRSRSVDLQKKIDRLATAQGVEEEVRSKFSVAKEDENMVIIIQDEIGSSTKVQKQSLWSRFTALFSSN